MKSHHFKFDSGKTFPPAAQGLGLVPVLFAGLAVFGLENPPWLVVCLLVLVGLILNFSRTTIVVHDGEIFERNGIWMLRLAKRVPVERYSFAVVRIIKGSYHLKNVISTTWISPEGYSRVEAEPFNGLFLMEHRSGEKELLYKGSKQQISDFIIKSGIYLKVKCYKGVVREGYELDIASMIRAVDQKRG